MNILNKLFKIHFITRCNKEIKAVVSYIYFEEQGMYMFVGDTINSCTSRNFWRDEVERVFKSGTKQSCCYQYEEVSLGILLTSEHEKWRKFAKERLPHECSK